MATTVSPISIDTEEEVGSPTIDQGLNTTSILSEEEVGEPTVSVTYIWQRIAEFDPDLWQSLFDREQYAYASASGANRSVYEPKFKDMGDGILAYFDTDWTEDVRRLVTGLYGYIIFHSLYGTDDSLLAQSDAVDVFGLGGIVDRIGGDPISYYADYSGGTTPHLDADISTIQSAKSYDVGKINTLLDGYQTTVAAKTHDLLFDDFAVQSLVDKHQMGVKIFTELGYERIYKVFNLDLNIPAYIN